MTKSNVLLKKIRSICLALPDAVETTTWGKPHFRVGEKIFAGCGEDDGRFVLSFKLGMDYAAVVVKDEKFWKAKYVGHKGWVSTDATTVDDWDEIKSMIAESYRLIAPKRTLAKLEGAPVSKTTRKSVKNR